MFLKLVSFGNTTYNGMKEMGQTVFQTACEKSRDLDIAFAKGIDKHGVSVVLGEGAVTAAFLVGSIWAARKVFVTISIASKSALLGHSKTDALKIQNEAKKQAAKYASIAAGCAAIGLYNLYASVTEYSQST